MANAGLVVVETAATGQNRGSGHATVGCSVSGVPPRTWWRFNVNRAASESHVKIICAPDSFKECLSAADVAGAMAQGIRRAAPEAMCDECPVGDGGEGTMDALVSAIGGAYHSAQVTGPRGERVTARFGVLNDSQRTGIVELAQASGLALAPAHARDPVRTTTLGTGELIWHATEIGCGEIIVCIGGSATVDGGTGIAQALGVQFIDRHGHEITEPMCGGRLMDIARVNVGRRLKLPVIRVACDVTNPLCGPNGAASVYGPQKGATLEQVRLLEVGLAHLAGIVAGDPDISGSGAAGGAGFGLVHLCGATLERGIDLVLDAVRFDERVQGADLVLTGEGRLDAKSLQGKACMGVAKCAAKFGVPAVAIVGDTGPGAEDCVGFAKGLLAGYVSLSDRFGRALALSQAASLINDVTSQSLPAWSKQFR